MTNSATASAGATRSPGDEPAPPLLPDRARRLRRINVLLFLLHGGQALVLVLLTTDFTIPITQTFPEGPPGSAAPASAPLLEPRLGFLVAAFLALAAIDHLVVALPGVHRTYERLLARSRQPFRWAEYSISATLMVLLIGSLSGITNVASLIGIAGANVAMILFGHRMERVNEGPPDRSGQGVTWQPFVWGCLVGLFPWAAIVVNTLGSEFTKADTAQGPPGFVYGIIASLFVLFMSFAVVQFLQMRARTRGGRFADPATTETAYLVLSLVAKSLLAWQIFANVLIAM